MSTKIIINKGDKRGRLTVVKELTPRKRNGGGERRVLLCRCDCGTEKEILLQSFNVGRVVSCGCKQKEVVKAGRFASKHGMSPHPLFNTWRKMISRCYDASHKGYKYYGAKGVIVCEEWRNSPQTFIEWAINHKWRPGLQLDKDIIGNGLLYAPSTCCFVTPYVNSMNRSCTKKKIGYVDPDKIDYTGKPAELEKEEAVCQ